VTEAVVKLGNEPSLMKTTVTQSGKVTTKAEAGAQSGNVTAVTEDGAQSENVTTVAEDGAQ
jgi:hypothetical protein